MENWGPSFLFFTHSIFIPINSIWSILIVYISLPIMFMLLMSLLIHTTLLLLCFFCWLICFLAMCYIFLLLILFINFLLDAGCCERYVLKGLDVFASFIELNNLQIHFYHFEPYFYILLGWVYNSLHSSVSSLLPLSQDSWDLHQFPRWPTRNLHCRWLAFKYLPALCGLWEYLHLQFHGDSLSIFVKLYSTQGSPVFKKIPERRYADLWSSFSIEYPPS